MEGSFTESWRGCRLRLLARSSDEEVESWSIGVERAEGVTTCVVALGQLIGTSYRHGATCGLMTSETHRLITMQLSDPRK